jgi:hypothetical protein
MVIFYNFVEDSMAAAGSAVLAGGGDGTGPDEAG